MPGDEMARRPAAPRGRLKATHAERRSARAEVDDPAAVLAAAARFLEARARSVHEVRRRLGDAGYRSDLVDGAIDRLTELGMLDDEAFARAWVESRDRARPRGARALRDELRRKGITQAAVDAVLAERDGQGDDADSDAEGGGRGAAQDAPAFGQFGQLRPRPGSQLEAGERADTVAARRLLAHHAAALARVPDPRKRRQRAYGLLARNGFAPDLIGSLVRELEATGAAGNDGDERDEAGTEGV